MEPTTKDPAFEFSDRPVTGQHFQPSRTAAEVEALLSTLKEAPGMPAPAPGRSERQ